MQTADVFEEFKVVVKPLVKAQVVDDFGAKHVEAIKASLKNTPYSLIAIFDKDTVHYRNPDIKVISTGIEWCLLDDFMRESAKIN